MRRTSTLRRCSTALAVTALMVGVASVVTLAPASQASGGWHSFGGVGLGAIPDGSGACAPSPGAALDVTFTVTGMPVEQLSDVRISGLAITHSFVGDVVVSLISPGGAQQRVLFGRTGATTGAGFGDSSNLVGPYTFTDRATPSSGGWWQATAAAMGGETVVPTGDYFATVTGGADLAGGTATSITGAFAAVTDPNGVWTLRVTDGCAGDVGSVTAASLDLRPASEACALEQSDVSFAQGVVVAATTALTEATRAKGSAQNKVISSTKAVKKAKQALKRAREAKKARAKAKLAKAVAARAKAKAAGSKAVQRADAAEAALVAAADVQTRSQAALTACQQE